MWRSPSARIRSSGRYHKCSLWTLCLLFQGPSKATRSAMESLCLLLPRSPSRQMRPSTASEISTATAGSEVSICERSTADIAMRKGTGFVKTERSQNRLHERTTSLQLGSVPVHRQMHKSYCINNTLIVASSVCRQFLTLLASNLALKHHILVSECRWLLSQKLMKKKAVIWEAGTHLVRF